jgi:ABC-type lipoprotein export system ATPase subunit
VLLADEPTGNLDPDTAAEIMKYLADFHRQGGTLVVVTHSPSVERYADRIVLLREGRIQEDPPNPS